MRGAFLYFNAEDSDNVLRGRYLANCLRKKIDQRVFHDRLYLQSGIQWPDMFFMTGELVINEAVFAHLAQFAADRQIDVIIFDPLQDMSHADETNEAFRLLGQRLKTVCIREQGRHRAGSSHTKSRGWHVGHY